MPKPAEKPAKTLQPAPMRTPAHGGGALRAGNPGNKGGTGRTPSSIRAAARRRWANRLPILTAIADGVAIEEVRGPDGRTLALKSAAVIDRLRAMDQLAKVGMGGGIAIDDVRDRLTRQVEVIRGALPAADADRLLSLLAEVWT